MFSFLRDASSPGKASPSSPQSGDSSGGTLLDLFESFALNDATRENIALCTEMGVQMSYRELDEKAGNLSAQINSYITQDGRPHLVGNFHISFPSFFMK